MPMTQKKNDTSQPHQRQRSDVLGVEQTRTGIHPNHQADNKPSNYTETNSHLAIDRDDLPDSDELPREREPSASIASVSNPVASTLIDAKSFLKTLSAHPGVYMMVGEGEQILYVGKAKNLKKRVSSYFRRRGLAIKTESLMRRVHHINTTITQSETEALLLEQSLIKSHRPPYNITLRDDKSYPFIFLSEDHDFPRLAYHRGTKKAKGKYYGPYPSAGAVHESIHILERVFMIRSCSDIYYRHRSRPCLQYQIKRCSGPCVGLVSKQDYADQCRMANLFLTGKNQALLDEFADRMEAAADKLEYEKAAQYRDQLSYLQKIQEQQYVVGEQGDVDVIAAQTNQHTCSVQVLFVRSGRVLGSRTFFPKTNFAQSIADILSAFIPQYYLHYPQDALPKEIIINGALEDQDLISQVLSQHAGRKIQIVHQVRGGRAKWLALTELNAAQQLASKLADQSNLTQRFADLTQVLGLSQTPKRMECFDISHSSGEATIASCVVFTQDGPLKSDYRKYNISDIQAGDDYAAMEQVLRRRYSRMQTEEGKWPDLVLIDGGKGQLHMAERVMAALGIDHLILIGVAKGPTRKAGFESIILSPSHQALSLAANAPARHLIQHIRDESHRFAIQNHRKKRAKNRQSSQLEDIEGIGPKRRRELLRHFGGFVAVQRASIEELAKVNNISKKLAEQIYHQLHDKP